MHTEVELLQAFAQLQDKDMWEHTPKTSNPDATIVESKMEVAEESKLSDSNGRMGDW